MQPGRVLHALDCEKWQPPKQFPRCGCVWKRTQCRIAGFRIKTWFSSMGYTHLQTLPNTSTTSFRKNENVDIENHAKCRYIGGCYTSIGGQNCALSLRKRPVEQISGVKIRVYRKRYIRVFVNPCHPQARTCQRSLENLIRARHPL